MSKIGADKTPAPEGTPNPTGIEEKNSSHIDQIGQNASYADCSCVEAIGGFEKAS